MTGLRCLSERRPTSSHIHYTSEVLGLEQPEGISPTWCVLLQNIDDDANTHDRVLWAVHISGMDDLLKFLASSQSEQQWSLHVLEIISLMFRDQVGQ